MSIITVLPLTTTMPGIYLKHDYVVALVEVLIFFHVEAMSLRLIMFYLLLLLRMYLV